MTHTLLLVQYPVIHFWENLHGFGQWLRSIQEDCGGLFYFSVSGVWMLSPFMFSEVTILLWLLQALWTCWPEYRSILLGITVPRKYNHFGGLDKEVWLLVARSNRPGSFGDARLCVTALIKVFKSVGNKMFC